MDKSTKIAWGITLGAIVAGALLERYSRTQSTHTYQNFANNMDVNLPRGYRNNNPLNIRISSNKWRGKVSPNTDGSFEQFLTMQYGYRAALATMRTYIRKYGLNTVAKIIGRWAPTNENNTNKYIQDVCRITNFPQDMKVGVNDKDTLTAMAYAMSIIENGNNDYTRSKGLPNLEIINQAWEML